MADLVGWARARNRRVVLVFDAWAGGTRDAREEAHGPVTVWFTRAGERADAFIVRWVGAHAEAVVVTSDRAVQQGARRRGAAVLDAESFAARLDGDPRLAGGPRRAARRRAGGRRPPGSGDSERDARDRPLHRVRADRQRHGGQAHRRRPGLVVPAGVFIYALTFTLLDLINERLGKRGARQVIGTAF